jgi:hypothetical protein
MGIENEALLKVRADLCDRIDALAEQALKLRAGQVATAVDGIRRVARDYGFDAVAEIAHSLESAMARADGAVLARPYLDAMRDLIGCETIAPHAAQAWLASIHQRLYG